MAVPYEFANQAGPIPLEELDQNFIYMLDSPVFTGAPSVDINNTDDALTLTTPDSTSATWDSQPLAALHIAGPPTPTTRNFLAGIWVETEGSATDKGRGIIITNTGASDGLYVQCDGVGATGIASLLTASSVNATGLVVGTTLASHVGVEVRQETSIVATAGGVLVTIQAEGASTEMIRIGSATKSQVGIVFRLFTAGSQPIVVKNAGGIDQFVMNNVGDIAGVGTISFTGIGDSFMEGIIKQGATAEAANNAQVVTVANVGPGAAGIAILGWRKTKDSAGNLRYIPLFG